VTDRHPAILTQDDLARLTGYERAAEIEADLRRQGVAVKRGKRGLWTTVDALNAALGLPNGSEPRLRLP
jgi:hypothetical protein